MYRHPRIASQRRISGSDYVEEYIDNSYTNRLLYVPVENTLSASFTAYPVSIAQSFTVSSWFQLNNTGNHVLFNIDDIYKIEQNQDEDVFTFKIKYFTDYIDVFSVFNTVNTAWFFVSVVKDYDSFRIYINNTEVLDVSCGYYPDCSVINVGSLTGKYKLLSLYDSIVFFNEYPLTALLEPLVEPTIENSCAINLQLDVANIDYVNNSIITTNNSNSAYNYKENRWELAPGGISIATDNFNYSEYTFEFEFSNIQSITNVILASLWPDFMNQCFYFLYDAALNKVKLVYNFGSVNTVILGDYLPNRKNTVAFVVENSGFSVYYNRELVITETITARRPIRFNFSFNKDTHTVTNTAGYFYLHKARLYSCVKYSSDTYLEANTIEIPSKTSPYLEKTRIYPTKINHHRKILNTFDLTLQSSNLNYNATSSFRLSHMAVPASTTYTVELLDDVNFVTFPGTVTIGANASYADFPVTINTYPVDNEQKIIYFLVKVGHVGKIFQFVINDTRVYSLAPSTSVSGYIDGFIVDGSNTFSSLSATRTYSSSADLVETIAGPGLEITNISEAGTISPAITNVRTTILVYKEKELKSNRGYVGSSTTYTFNGSPTGQLVGNLILDPDQIPRVLEANLSADAIAVSKNGSVLVYTSLGKLYLLEKTNAGVFPNSPLELATEIPPDLLVNCDIKFSEQETSFCIGIKNANLGEGKVQLWRKIGSTWTRELNLGSPLPSPNVGGFGTAVGINTDGTVLAVSQPGSSSIFIFRKNSGLWDSEPDDAILGSASLGASLDLNSDGTILACTEPNTATGYIYRYSITWALDTTITQCISCFLNKSTNSVLFTNHVNKICKYYKLISSSYSLSKTFTSSEETFGFTGQIVSNQDIIYISSPADKKIYKYNSSNSYTSPIYTFIETIDDFGYCIAINETDVFISNLISYIYLYSTTSLGNITNILSVRQHSNTSSVNDILNLENINILVFITNSPINIDLIGKTNTDLTLNGIFYGALFYNRVLSISEIDVIEKNISKYLNIDQYV